MSNQMRLLPDKTNPSRKYDKKPSTSYDYEADHSDNTWYGNSDNGRLKQDIRSLEAAMRKLQDERDELTRKLESEQAACGELWNMITAIDNLDWRTRTRMLVLIGAGMFLAIAMLLTAALAGALYAVVVL